MSADEEDIESTEIVYDFPKTASNEYLEYNSTKITIIPNIIVDIDEEEIGSEISKPITVILKAITHRGTQTKITCDPDEPRENFLDMVINVKI